VHNLIPAQQPIRTVTRLSCPTLSTSQPITLRASLPEQDYGRTKQQTGSRKLRKTGTGTYRPFFVVPFSFPRPPFRFPALPAIQQCILVRATLFFFFPPNLTQSQPTLIDRFSTPESI
jgi:hypothetical protein